MPEIFGVPAPVLYGQLLLGLVNGSFYALLSLGLSLIFGLLNIVNFAHGTMYMLGAFLAYLLLNPLGLGYWWAIVLVPLMAAGIGIVVERTILRRIYKLDHIYGLLVTFGLTMIIEGLVRVYFGVSGLRYSVPALLHGMVDLGFMRLPVYRVWVIVAALGLCLFTWLVIERTRLGATLRAGTENSKLVQAFGVNVPLLVTLVFGWGVALAAFAGVLAAPLMQLTPQIGHSIIITVFGVVVIGGMGSILGSIVTGVGLGLIEGLAKVYYPEASSTAIFVLMILVLLVRPHGLFGKQ
ncbi:MAG: branched-chain amino acid ABC transporter permease [Stappia sp.]|uniref:branched-chain amino acid ABC transporter permease n=1 Tax=Stappia sp. TaxID=1870903 RepID=UPI000C614D50|nr:branched-chain amino acid ABC transporter permease [Stappia sp.]MAB00013.1 branched-chain amino acid ABC transporter permease [Stappia sp.]MBM22196.1 branched-chain amino acid ABC transporter permease [Stappia sp.]